MGARWRMLLAGLVLVSLSGSSAFADRLIHPQICKRAHLSEETRALCERIDGLEGRDRLKALALHTLQRTNQPPVAALSMDDPTPAGRIHLDATESVDHDGFIEHYTFQLFDAETGAPLSSGVVTRNPFATLTVDGALPPQVRATVTVEDDERATDTTELNLVSGAQKTCKNNVISCTMFSSGQMDCYPVSGTFSTDDVLDAAQQCDSSLTKDSPILILAVGGAGGRGANFWPNHGASGGTGGVAAMTTTLTLLDQTFGGPGTTTYCYGIGRDGSHGDTHSGSGGASTLLRTCENVSQNDANGLVVLAGGGGGGAAAGVSDNFYPGGRGGIAFSTTAGACPPPGNCASGSTYEGGGDAGKPSGTSGGGGWGFFGECQILGQEAANGHAGVGGHGGTAQDTPVATWSQGSPMVSGDTGAGGTQVNIGGGAGGGGYGGGSGGGGNSNGGGGGGSFAAESFRDFTLGDTSGSRLEFVFNWPGFSN